MSNLIIYIDDFARANFQPPYNDWTPIVAAALASFPTSNDYNGKGMGGTIVFAPSPGQPSAPSTPGAYNFLTPMIAGLAQGYGIELNRAVKLCGVSGAPAGNSLGNSQLIFAAGLGGVRINSQGYPTNGLLGADGSLIEGLSLLGAGATKGPSTAHGVFFNTTCTLRDLTIGSFSGDGVNTHADSGDTPPTSSSVSRVDNVYALYNGGNGVSTSGADANSICFTNFKARGNTGWGVYESSFIGCQYIGGYAEGNQGGGVWANHPSGESTFVGFYVENGDTVTVGPGNCIFGDQLAMEALKAGSSASIFSCNGLGGNISTSADGNSVLAIGDGFNDPAMFMGWKDTTENGGAWPFRFKNFGNGALGPDCGETGQPIFALLNSRALKANGYPVDAANIPDIAAYGGFAVRGIVLGAPASKLSPQQAVIFEGVSTSIPTSTAYPVGSVMHNANAVNVGDPTLWKLVNRSGSLKWVIGATLQS